MVALLAFYLGWTMGARSGPDGAKEVRDAAASLRKSQEFKDLVGTLRTHSAGLIRELADRMENPGAPGGGVPDVLARAYSILRPQGGGATTR